MVATTQLPPDKVRELQRSLFMAAKRNLERRFHAVYDRIRRSDFLLEAWRWTRYPGGAHAV
jgi:RNA-directed DNA polymerase